MGFHLEVKYQRFAGIASSDVVWVTVSTSQLWCDTIQNEHVNAKVWRCIGVAHGRWKSMWIYIAPNRGNRGIGKLSTSDREYGMQKVR